MKVIGTTGDGFVIVLETNEMAQLRGFASRYCEGWTNPTIGAVFKVGPIFHDATTALDQQRAALAAAKSLRSSADRFLRFFETEEENKKDAK